MDVKYPVYQPSLKGNERKYILECLETNWISSKGNFITQFESEFAAYMKAGYATSVCNGTAAVLLALLALEIGEGDEVIVPDMVYVAVPNMVKVAGAEPVFVDSLRHTYQMDPADIRAKITERTKAVIAVHTYGLPCEMDEIRKICDEKDLWLIEDCAEALGSQYQGKPVGSWGDVSVYSFFGNKTITTGEGGMVTSQDEKLIRKVYHLKNQGVTTRTYWHDLLAYNFRMTNLTAAIGLAQLERVNEILALKKQIASEYQGIFKSHSIEFHSNQPDAQHSYWMCSILSKLPEQREPLRDFLLLNGIETRPFFYPVHTMPMYLTHSNGQFPVVSEISSRGINLPSYPDLKDEDVKYIANKVLEFYQGK